MEDSRSDLLNRFMRYHNLLIRYHHQCHRNQGPFVDTMRGQGRVLSILKMKPEITQKELSYLLDMRVQSLSELLSKLEGKGYITRTPSPADRRVLVVRLTGQGAAAVEETDPTDTDHPFRCLGPEEQESLAGYLDRLIAAMEDELGEPGPGPGQSFDFDQFREQWERAGGRGRGGHHPPPPSQEEWERYAKLFGRGRRGWEKFWQAGRGPEDDGE